MATSIKSYEVQPGDRIDLIAEKLLGDPEKLGLIITENPYLDIWDPQPGMLIKVPNE